MAMTETHLPRWDMTPLFGSLTSPDFEDAFDHLVRDVGALRDLFDAHGVRRLDDGSVDEATAAAFEEVTDRLNAIAERVRLVRSYIYAFVTTDATDDLAQAKLSELQTRLVDLEKLSTRYEAWVGTLDAETLIERSDTAREHAFFVRRAAVGADHQLGEAEEDLAATLSPSGQAAWSKLHGNITSRLVVQVTKPDGSTEELPMSAVRGLAHDPDAGVREAAYRAELAAWETVAVPLAAALNGVKGWEGTLDARRGWPDVVASSLHRNNVDRATLEAMQRACVDAFPSLRRYLKLKAKLTGRDALPWWDLFAPVGEAGRHWSYDEATSFVVDRFGAYSDRLAGLAGRAFDEAWVDAGPRPGKRDGAFCMGVRADESRVLLNFNHHFGSVSTLAHELGHAYHNVNLASRTPLQRQTPMALAETASIFCQTIVMDAMLAEASADEELAILEGELQHACQIVVDIHSRFLFERSVFEARAARELSVAELCDRMLEAQLATYGDGLDPEALHPYMWAVKPHYYSRSFYNWPYTFGMLFGLGLYACYRADPEAFRAGYDDLLSSTGLDDAAGLARRFGIDVTSESFWSSSLDVVRERVERFERLV